MSHCLNGINNVLCGLFYVHQCSWRRQHLENAWMLRKDPQATKPTGKSYFIHRLLRVSFN